LLVILELRVLVHPEAFRARLVALDDFVEFVLNVTGHRNFE